MPGRMAKNPNEFVTRLYTGEDFVAEVAILPLNEDINIQLLFQQEMRVTKFSQQSERCLPLQVLHTIGTAGVCFKMCASQQQLLCDSHGLEHLHNSCLNEAKTAVISLKGGHELHLVAMLVETGERIPCFWAYMVAEGLYASCLHMFNLRCLSIVFDLDETLIVANTLRSFEDRLEALKVSIESPISPKYVHDPVKRSQVQAEFKRFQEDRAILKQYIENDTVYVNGRAIRAQNEIVPPVVDGALPLNRPIIRLPERNMILTRINPAVRDTSVLVKFRPAWDELRSYVIAKGRKRFEVYICTMSERDYALEMWRLLDPEGQLINVKELNDRVLCVDAGGKKSLENVFARQTCHPKMAMVIDDRIKVWEKKDQPRVHVVAPFAPYFAPQAEMVAGGLPVLYVARNVACNVRGGFFRDFDDNLHQQMTAVRYDTDLASLPQPPDVCNYLVTEELQEVVVPGFGSHVGSKDFPDGIGNADPETRLHPEDSNGTMQSKTLMADNEDLRLTLRPPVQTMQLFVPPQLPDPAMLDSQNEDCHYLPPITTSMRPLSSSMSMLSAPKASSPVREEGEVPESELDPDTRRRLLILQHGQDTGQAHVPPENVEDSSFPSLQVSLAGTSAGGWLGAEEEMSPRQPPRSSPLILEPESPSFDRVTPLSFQLAAESSLGAERESRMSRRHYSEEVFLAEERRRADRILLDNTTTGNGPIHTRTQSQDAVNVLKEIGEKCQQLVEYRILSSSSEISVEVIFGGEKIGEGVGRTMQDAKQKAAEHALRCLAKQFATPARSSGSGSALPSTIYSGELNDSRVHRRGSRDLRMHVGVGPRVMDSAIPSTSGQPNYLDYRLVEEPVSTRAQFNAVMALKELCQMEGLSLAFSPLQNSRRGLQCHVEVGGKLLGKGSGPSWEAAKQQAAEETLRNLQLHPSSGPHKRTSAPRSPSLHPNKRPRAGDYLRGASPLRHVPGSPHRGRHRLSPNKRYSKSGLPI